MTAQQAMEAALAAHRAGRVEEAIAAYRGALSIHPHYLEAAVNLAGLLRRTGRLDHAIETCRQGLTHHPTRVELHYNLANALQDAGKSDEAIASYQKAIALRPDYADAHNNLGNAFRQRRDLDAAIAAYSTAIRIRPNYAEACNNLGVALAEAGRWDEALNAYRKAIELKPTHAPAHNNLGNALRERQDSAGAIAAYTNAIRVNPDYAEAYVNLSVALKDSGRLDDAVAACLKAIQLQPNSAQAYNNLGTVLSSLGRADEAIAAYSRAVELKPLSPTKNNVSDDAHINLAAALTAGGRFDEAVAVASKAIDLHRDCAEAHHNLGNALRGKGHLDHALAAYRRATDLRPLWHEPHANLAHVLRETAELDKAIAAYRRAIDLDPNLPAIHSDLLYTLHFHPAYDARAIADEHRRWNDAHARFLSRKITSHDNDCTPGRRLRIGYASPDFRGHCQSLFTLPLLSNHDHDQFEIFCYSSVLRPDALTKRLVPFASTWRNVALMSDTDLADQIRCDRIDILIDLTMHMPGGRPLLMARKPAPVQIAWLAYPGTTGLETIDYRLSDPHLDPPGADTSFYSEQTFRLPHTFWCYDPLENQDLPVNSLPALKAGAITFGCLNNFCKVNDGLLDLWAQVLGAVKHSRLLLLAHPGIHRQRATDRLSRNGIDPSRTEFISPQAHRGYLEAYHRIDLGLDSIPYNGHTTSLDCYWMGVPVITLVGQTIVGRAGLSQLTNLHLPELIAHSPDEFVQIASDLAHDLPRLTVLRATLRQRMRSSPLMDANRFTRDIEAAYRKMWQKWVTQ